MSARSRDQPKTERSLLQTRGKTRQGRPPREPFCISSEGTEREYRRGRQVAQGSLPARRPRKSERNQNPIDRARHRGYDQRTGCYGAFARRGEAALERLPLSGAKLTLPGSGRVRRSPPSRWRLLQSRRLLAPDHVACRMRATDYTRTIDFAFQRRRVYRKVTHNTRAARASVYRGDASRREQISL